MKRKFMLFVLLTMVFIITGCNQDTSDPDDQNSQQSLEEDDRKELTDEQKELNELLQTVEDLITEKQNYTVSTLISVRKYSTLSSLTVNESNVSMTEKYDLDQQSSEYTELEKIDFDEVVNHDNGFRVIDDRVVSFSISGNESMVTGIRPYAGNYLNIALANLNRWEKNVPESIVFKNSEDQLVVSQSIWHVFDPIKQGKFNDAGYNQLRIDPNVLQFTFDYDSETNTLTITAKKDEVQSTEGAYSYADLLVTMTFYDIGETSIHESITGYNGKVGSDEESVLSYSDVESLYDKPYPNYNYYKIHIDEPSFYKVEWTNGRTRPGISYYGLFDKENDRHEWIDDEAIYFEQPGDYLVEVHDSFSLKKQDYQKHNNIKIDHTQTVTYTPNGEYDFSKLYVQNLVRGDRSYLKIKISDNGRLYDDLWNRGKEEVPKANDGFYYTNGGMWYLMSSDGNPVTIEAAYELVDEKDEASVLTDTYSDYYYGNHKYSDVVTYHVLNVTEAGDYMISASFLGERDKGTLNITNIYGEVLFERENHSIVHLEPGMYYIYLTSESDSFYQMKYTVIPEVE